MTAGAAVLDGPVHEVAPRLLGMHLRTRLGGAITEVRIFEVEAYGGEDDPASHAYGGRTRRNRSMFEPAGTLYVYRSYGVHWCANIVTGMAGRGEAVLVRGGYPVRGVEAMIARRRRTDHLADGPGKLTQALAIEGRHDGSDVFRGPVRLLTGEAFPVVDRTPRIGISRARDRLWRFVGRDAIATG